MISAWDVYWVMQLDSISGLFEWIAWLSVPVTVGLAWIGALISDIGSNQTDDEKILWARAVQWIKRTAALGIACAVTASFIPSTKTAAAMIVLPSIANNETLHREAGELYGLAKQALKEAVSGDAPAKAAAKD